MKAYNGTGVLLHSLMAKVDRGKGPALSLCRFVLEEKASPVDLVGPRASLDVLCKIYSLRPYRDSNPGLSSPQPSHCNDCAIFPWNIHNFKICSSLSLCHLFSFFCGAAAQSRP